MKMKIFILICITITALFLFPLSGHSQPIKNISEMTKEEVLKMTYDELLDLSFEDLTYLAEKLGISVDELLNMKLTVSKKELPLREQPSIVSVITTEDIANSGATDLIEVLQMIPGINFGYDTEGVIGIIMRGNWANEGKILLLVDGMEMNEQFYYSMQFGNHYPIEQIKRIEIIRGPGSAIYGGSAELGVINIITRNGDDINGLSVSPIYSQMNSNYGILSAAISSGVKIKDFNISLHGYISERNRSEDNFSNLGDTVYNLSDGNSLTKQRWLNFQLSYKGIQTRFIFDE